MKVNGIKTVEIMVKVCIISLVLTLIFEIYKS